MTNYAEDNRWFKHPIDYFVDKQLHYINQGYTKDDAYNMAEADLQAEALEEDKEIELATEQAQLMDVPLRMVPWGYEQLSVSFKDNLAKMTEASSREIREDIERLVMGKKEANDHLPFTEEELEDYSNFQIENYLKKHPQDQAYFPPHSYSRDTQIPNEYLNTVTWKNIFPQEEEWETPIDTQPQGPVLVDPEASIPGDTELDEKPLFMEHEEHGFKPEQSPPSSSVLDGVLKSLTEKYDIGDVKGMPQGSHPQEPSPAPSPQSSNDAIKRLLRKLKGK